MKLQRLSIAIIAALLLSGGFTPVISARADNLGAEAAQSWDQWIDSRTTDTDQPVVQNREISKNGKFQLYGPLLGLSNRQDFYTTYIASIAARYHFDERSAWQFVRLDYTYPSVTGLAEEIQAQTEFHPDVQLSRFQLGTAYVYTPIYGKYAWNSGSLVYFDIFGTLGAGIRFANDKQPFAEAGVGMNHYLFSKRFAIVPELRWRCYFEQRTENTFVSEGLFQLGTSWLF